MRFLFPDNFFDTVKIHKQMPYTIVKSKGGYRVRTSGSPGSGKRYRYFSKGPMTAENAKKQLKILEKGGRPKRLSRRRRSGRRSLRRSKRRSGRRSMKRMSKRRSGRRSLRRSKRRSGRRSMKRMSAKRMFKIKRRSSRRSKRRSSPRM